MSINDWERHWIGPGALCSLYQVHPHECLVWTKQYGVVGYSRDYLAKLLHLYPRVASYRPVSERERALYPLDRPDRATDLTMGELTFMMRMLELSS